MMRCEWGTWRHLCDDSHVRSRRGLCSRRLSALASWWTPPGVRVTPPAPWWTRGNPRDHARAHTRCDSSDGRARPPQSVARGARRGPAPRAQHDAGRHSSRARPPNWLALTARATRADRLSRWGPCADARPSYLPTAPVPERHWREPASLLKRAGVSITA